MTLDDAALPDGICEKPAEARVQARGTRPREAVPPAPPRRARPSECRDRDGVPVALVVVLVVGGVCVLSLLGVALGMLLVDQAPAPIVMAQQDPLIQEPPLIDREWAGQAKVPPWAMMPPGINVPPFEDLPAPFFDRPPQPRPPFQAEGKLVTLDLKAKINWQRDEAIDLGSNDLGNLPMGENVYAGVKFNVQGGAILLGGRPQPPSGRPLDVAGIATPNAKFKRLYAFQGAHYGTGREIEIGGYRLHYDDGLPAVLPIIYGADVTDWFFGATVPTADRARHAWSGRNGASDITFYVSRYDNPHPEKTVARIDFYATNNGAAPFCLGLTVEE